jgi:hypothetical protein
MERKWQVLLAVGALLFGLSSVASAAADFLHSATVTPTGVDAGDAGVLVSVTITNASTGEPDDDEADIKSASVTVPNGFNISSVGAVTTSNSTTWTNDPLWTTGQTIYLNMSPGANKLPFGASVTVSFTVDAPTCDDTPANPYVFSTTANNDRNQDGDPSTFTGPPAQITVDFAECGWCARQGALTWRWKSSTRPARGRVSRTARVSWVTGNLEEAEGKALA